MRHWVSAGLIVAACGGPPTVGERPGTSSEARRWRLPDQCSEELLRPCRELYFPVGFARSVPDEVRPRQLRRWVGFLRAFHEPSLAHLAPDIAAARFLWIRSFHAPITIRVERGQHRARLLFKRLSGAGGYDVGELEISRPVDLTEEQWFVTERQVADAIAAPAPEPAAPARESSASTSGGTPRPIQFHQLRLDGAEWIVESARDGRHTAVSEWSPEDGPVRELGLSLLRMAGVEIEPAGVY